MAMRPGESPDETILTTAKLLPKCRRILETSYRGLNEELVMTRRSIGLALTTAAALLDQYNDNSTPEEERPAIIRELRKANSLTADFISDWERKKGSIKVLKN